jgi:uncharacterized membrane protein YhaH (DUF805 family)
LPIGSWIIRNYFISGTPTGQRAISSYSLYQNLVFFYDTLLSWYLPVNSIINFIIIFILLIAGWIILKSNIDKPFNKINLNKILHVLLFVLFYSCFIIISSTTTAYDRISDRLLSPIYIPLIFILFFLMDKIFNWLSDRFNKLLIKVLLTFCFISFIRFPLYSTLYIVQEFNCRTGVGYNTSTWTNSKTIEFLLQDKSIAERYKLYSNEPEILYFLTKLKSEYSPVKTFYNSPQLLSIEQNNNYINQNIKNGYLIWFSSSNRSFLFTINELHKNYELTEIESFDDGVIYTFN